MHLPPSPLSAWLTIHLLISFLNHMFSFPTHSPSFLTHTIAGKVLQSQAQYKIKHSSPNHYLLTHFFSKETVIIIPLLLFCHSLEIHLQLYLDSQSPHASNIDSLLGSKGEFVCLPQRNAFSFSQAWLCFSTATTKSINMNTCDKLLLKAGSF